jgi:hypothetical protein
MPNSFKYSTELQTLSLKKGNFYIGVGDVDKGPTSTTGYYNGITPPAGGYTIYVNKASNGPSIFVASNDTQLINFTNGFSGQNFTGATQCLNWYLTQTDYVCVNKDYGSIVTSGLVTLYDAGFTPSYSSSGLTWYDLSYGNNNGTLTNGPTFNSQNGGSIVFDGTDDYVGSSSNPIYSTYSGNPKNMEWTIIGSFNVSGSTLNQSLASIFQYNGVYISGFNDIKAPLMYPHPSFPLYGTINLVDNNIHNLAFTYSGTQISSTVTSITGKIYIDGSLNASQTTSVVEPFYFTNGLRLGSQPDGATRRMNGNLFNFMFYNRCLSASEVLQNYLSTINPKFIFGSNLKIWYDMSLQPSTVAADDVNTIDSSNNLLTVSRVYDLSGNGKHLTQTTKVSQPTFVPNSQNGKPANYNSGASAGSYPVMYAPSPALTTGARTFFIVLKGPSTSAFSWDRGGATRGSLQLGYAGGSGWNDLQQDTNFSIPGGNSTTTYVMSYMFDTTQSIFYRNGNLNRTQTNNTYTLNGNTFGCWWTAPSAGSQTGSWYEMVYLNKIPTISEYNAIVTYLGTKWGVSCGTLTNYN